VCPFRRTCCSGAFEETHRVFFNLERNEQIRARDQEIQDLTKHVNQVEEKLNDVSYSLFKYKTVFT